VAVDADGLVAETLEEVNERPARVGVVFDIEDFQRSRLA
jgi:hypothetical protein